MQIVWLSHFEGCRACTWKNVVQSRDHLHCSWPEFLWKGGISQANAAASFDLIDCVLNAGLHAMAIAFNRIQNDVM